MKNFSFCRCLFCLLLCAVLLPLPPVRAESEARLVTVNAEGLFEDEYYLIELLLCGDRYYIRPEEAAVLAGLELQPGSPNAVYIGPYISLVVSLDSIPSVNREGLDYYELETIMEQLQVFVMERDGSLVFNSVQNNLSRLLVLLHSMLDGEYDADYLDEHPILGSLLYGTAKIYTAIRELNINIYGTYSEDVRSLLVKLVTLDDEDEINRFRANTAAADEKLKRAAAYLLEDDQEAESAVNLPEGRRLLLFGARGSQFLKGIQEEWSLLNKNDVLVLMFELYFNEYKLDSDYDVLEDWTMPSILMDLGKTTVSDLISTGKFYVDVQMADFNYIRDLSRVLKAYNHALAWPLDLARREIIVDEATDLVGLYNQYINDKTGEITLSLIAQFLESFRDDLIGEVVPKILLTAPGALKVQIGVFSITAFLDYFGHTDTTAKMGSVMQMYEYKHIQGLFEDCLTNMIAHPNPEDAETCISAAKLYLKCSWNAIDLFSYENLGSDGVPTNTMKEQLNSLLNELMGFIPNEFIVVKPERIPGGSLKEQGTPEDNPLAPYITICYEDHFSFVSDWDGVIECSYEMPQVIGLSCSDEANALIASLFRDYVTTGDNNSYTVHIDPQYGTQYSFTDTFVVDSFAAATDWIGTILTEYSWEANIYNDILSIRITRMHYNPGNLAFLFEPDYDVINIDLLTQQIVGSHDVLWMIGIEEWDMENRISEGISELFTGFHDDDADSFMQITFNENPYQAVLDRGLYLSPDGVQVWVYAYMSKYGYKYILTLGF